MSRNGAWGYAMAREVREGTRELPKIQPGTTVTTDDELCELCGHSDAIHSGSMGCLGKFEDEDCLCEAMMYLAYDHDWEV